MSIKSKTRVMGRMLRRATGLSLPVCMQIGKMVVQGKPEYEIMAKHPTIFFTRYFQCGDKCCNYPIYTLKGKTQHIITEYSFSAQNITKEYNIIMRLREPMKPVMLMGEMIVYR